MNLKHNFKKEENEKLPTGTTEHSILLQYDPMLDVLTEDEIAEKYKNNGRLYNLFPRMKKKYAFLYIMGLIILSYGIAVTVMETKKNVFHSSPVRMERFSFHVMGDVPYTRIATKTLKQQMKNITQRVNEGQDDSLFIIHVGDLMNPAVSKCAEEYFQRPYQIFQDYSALPVLVVPGNNDVLNCPNPELAASHFKTYFIDPVDTWTNRSHIPAIIERSQNREENLAFYLNGVLFLGLHMVYQSESEPGSQERLRDNLTWFKSKFEQHLYKSRAIIIFGHSAGGERLFLPIQDMVRKTQIPLIYIHGDGHSFVESRYIGTKKMWDRFWRIQVDEGAKAPPLKITINDPNDEISLEITNEHQVIYNNMVKVDRMGGLY